MARQYFYAESLGESTTSSGSYVDKTTLTFTPDANSDYLLIWSCALNGNSLTTDVLVRLRHDTASVTLGEYNIEVNDTTDYQSLGGIEQVSFGASPASQTFSVEFSTEGGAGTAAIKLATITAIKVDAADTYAESEGSSTTTSSTFQDKATLTFTPASQGDYLVITSSEWHDPGSSGRGQYRLLDDSSTARAVTERVPKDVSNWMNHSTVIKRNLTAASKTFKTQWRNISGGATGVDIRNSRIFALRLDTLPAHFYGESLSRTTTTSTSYQDKVSLTDTTAVEDYLRIGVGVVDGNSTSLSCFFNFDQSGSLYESLFEPESTGGVSGASLSHLATSVYTGSAASTTWKTQTKSESGSITTGISDSAIAILQLTGTSGATGTIATTLDAATSSISATETMSGTIATTLADATAAFTGHMAPSGTLATTLADATSAITAVETFSGTLATTLADATSSISALETFSGSIATTLDDATANFVAVETFTGTLATTLDNAAADFSGTVIESVTGTLATTLDNFTSSISATETISGALATTLAGATAAFTGSEVFTGTLATTLADFTGALSGAVTFTGTLSASTADAVAAFSGLETFTGTLAAISEDATSDFTGQVANPVTGAWASTLSDFTMSASGTAGDVTGAGGEFLMHLRRRRR